MATRVEKKYKTDSLVMMNKVLNYVNDYIGSKKKLAEPERQLTENVVTEIDYFLNKNKFLPIKLRKEHKQCIRFR